MTSEPFVSRAPHAEDVLLVRALGDRPLPRFLELLGDAPSRCDALVEHGWAGRSTAPDQLGDAIADGPADALLVAAGAEPAAAAAIAAGTLRPSVVVLPATSTDVAAAPLGDALLAAGYRVVLFDGTSAFAVQSDDTGTAARLDHPAVPDGSWTTAETAALRERVAELVEARDQLTSELAAWRARSVEHWSDVAAAQRASSSFVEADRLREEIDAIRSTLSWRITAPLRRVRRRQKGR